MTNIIATFRYDDPRGAIDFLERAFGFATHTVSDGPNGTVAPAELRLGDDDWIMLGSSEGPEGDTHRMRVDMGPSWIYVIVEDPDAHFERAQAAGAEIVQGLKDEDYGSRGYTARDPGGNLWTFGTYRPAV